MAETYSVDKYHTILVQFIQIEIRSDFNFKAKMDFVWN